MSEEKNLPAKKDKSMELAPIPDNPLEEQGFIDLDENDKRVVHDYFQKMRYGPVYAGVLICKQHACDHAQQCPLVHIGKLPPVGSQCPIEITLMNQWASDLVIELEVDPTDIIDNAQIQSILGHRLFEKRARELLAHESSVIKVFRAMAMDGTPVFEPRIHPLILALRDNYKNLDRDLQSLIATREAKSKDKSRNPDQMQEVKGIMDRIKEIAEQARGNPMQIEAVVRNEE